MSLAFRTGARLPWSAPSARFVGLAIQERRDRANAKRQAKPRPTSLPAPVAEAQAWARRAGFTVEEAPRAAVCALFLRGVHGKGNVTVEMVRTMMRGSG